MNSTNLIQKYFDPSPMNSEGDFNQWAYFFVRINCVYKYEKLESDKIRIFFQDKSEYRDQAIVENGRRVGIATLVTPHTIETRRGTLICTGVKKITDKKITNGQTIKDFSISNKIWSKALNIKINNKHLNVKIECDAIYPESFTLETLSDRV